MTPAVASPDQNEHAAAMNWRTDPQGDAFIALMNPHRPPTIEQLGRPATAAAVLRTNGDLAPDSNGTPQRPPGKDFPIQAE